MSEPLAAAAVRRWLAGPLPRDVAQSLDRLARTDDVHYLAVMPDVHLSHDVCTGVAVATKHRLYPHAVGSDLGCGMLALGFHGAAAVLGEAPAAARLLAGLYRTVHAIRRPRAMLRERLPEALADVPLSDPRLEKLKGRDGRVEFGTLGRGNHFLEFQGDDEGRLWLMIHSGSRAVGQAVHAHHLGRAHASNTGLPFLDADSAAGRAYLADLEWACRYADASRREMAAAVAALVAELFGIAADLESLVCCNHNHVRREEHGGESLWVHRKGAISARPGEPGIIPGSMGADSFHVAGRGRAEALCSSSHGAGRRLSRAEAQRTVSARALHRQMQGVWFDQRLTDRLRDEAPAAYKDIHAVMRAQRDLTCIVRRLHPVLSYKGA
jgi:tRNA-splicing ligase RtcB